MLSAIGLVSSQQTMVNSLEYLTNTWRDRIMSHQILRLLVTKTIVTCITCLLLFQPSSYAQDYSLSNSSKFIQLQTKNNNSFVAYSVGPKKSKRGLLLIHGWWGLNREIKIWADSFATAGYRVMAIDLFNQQTTSHPKKAQKLVKSVNQAEANEKFVAIIKALSMPDRKLAVIGRSFGANQAMHATMVGKDNISATIVYYPFKEIFPNKKLITPIKSPVLAHFAKNDYFFPLKMQTQFTSSLKALGTTISYNIYNARHAFTNPTGKNFNQPAQKLSQQRTQEFLNIHLN